jgi:hypothetical protein
VNQTHITAIEIFAQLRGFFAQRLRRLHHLAYHRLLDLRKLFRLHRPQLRFRGGEEGLERCQRKAGCLSLLCSRKPIPTGAHVHREGKDRVAKLLFGTQLVIEPRLNNLPSRVLAAELLNSSTFGGANTAASAESVLLPAF